MKLFVTGGTGFIGSHYLNYAHEVGHTMICLHRQGSTPRIILKNQPKWIEGSMLDNWHKELSCCEVFVHLAAHSTNVPYDSLTNCLYWNLNVSLQLLEQARESGIKKFIIAGTGFEYGLSGNKYEYIPVNAPLEPTMNYSASKAAASIAFIQWAIEYKLKLKYLRIFQVFGEGEAESRLWPSLKKAALSGKDFHLTGGEQIRDFTKVEEMTKKIVNALDFSEVKEGQPQIYNLGTGDHKTIKEFAEFYWNKWNAKGNLFFGTKPYRANEIMRLVPLI